MLSLIGRYEGTKNYIGVVPSSYTQSRARAPRKREGPERAM